MTIRYFKRWLLLFLLVFALQGGGGGRAHGVAQTRVACLSSRARTRRGARAVARLYSLLVAGAPVPFLLPLPLLCLTRVGEKAAPTNTRVTSPLRSTSVLACARFALGSPHQPYLSAP